MSNQILKIEVLGAHDIEFMSGCRTGDMKEDGISVSTVFWSKLPEVSKFNDMLLGGCMRREDCYKLRDYLNKCISEWESEKK